MILHGSRKLFIIARSIEPCTPRVVVVNKDGGKLWRPNPS